MSAKRTMVLLVAVLLTQSLTGQAQSNSGSTPIAPDVPATYWDRSLSAPQRALELSLSTSLVAGLGQAADHASHHVSETVDAGTSAQIGVGYRASPVWALGATAAYEHYNQGPPDSSATTTEGALARAVVTYHFNPNSRADSWVSGGAGYRWLRKASAAANTHDFHGFELASVATGLDLRIVPRVAFGPAFGMDLNALFWDGSKLSADQHLSVFWYLGLQVRVDLAGGEQNVGNLALR